MRVAIDTNRYIDLCKGVAETVQMLQHNLALHARDKHFDHLPQLVRV